MVNEIESLMTDAGPAWRYVLTDADRDIIRSKEVVADGVAAIFGRSCEVVLHSLEDISQSIVKIVNGINTGRSVRSPITGDALTQLHDIAQQENGDVRSTYKRTADDILLKSTSMVIRNGNMQPIGMLCININMSAPTVDFLQAFIPEGNESNTVAEHFPTSVDDLVEDTVDRTIHEVNSNQQLSNKVKNKHIIMALYDKGIFDIKESVSTVARKLGVSRHTVYLYIRQRRVAL